MLTMRPIRAIRRRLRPAVKTVQSIALWKRFAFDDAPPIFGNAKAKSGSHLLLQVLAGFTRVLPCAYVEAEPIRTITKDGRRRPPGEVLSELERIPRGVIGWGYLKPSPDNVDFLCRPDRVNYFIYRDPRDMLVSQVFFATDMHEEHGMHALYNSLPDFGARLQVAITGIEQNGLKMVSVRQRYEDVLRWLDQKHVLCLRFEDLVNDRLSTLSAVLDEVEKTGYLIPTPRQRALTILAEAIEPKKSRTFRSGKTGGWREYFTDEHKQLFRQVAGDLLVRLAYEKDNNW
jgi:hypothetical protein